MPPKVKPTKRKRQLMEEAKKGREARKKLRMSIASSVRGNYHSGKRSGTSSSTSTSRRSYEIACPESNNLASVSSHGNLGMGIGPESSLGMGMGPDGCLSMGMGPEDSQSIGIEPGGIEPGAVTSPGAAASSSFPHENTGNSRPEDILRNFSDQWKLTLDQEDQKSLALFLCHVFTTELKMSHSKAADHAGKIIGKTKRTIRQWRSDLITYGEIKESKKGKYERPKVLWANKELSDKARTFVQANTAFVVQGKQSTMKVKDFCQWVNETLLPNQAVASLYSFVPGFGYAPAPMTANQQTPLPQKISMETARKWLRELGF